MSGARGKRYSEVALYGVVLHEIGHAVGIGTLIWRDFIVDSDDPHHTGKLTRQAFDRAGGVNYKGKKVPVQRSTIEQPFLVGSHWREDVFGDELMTSIPNKLIPTLSAITAQALADMGYVVDVSKADPYKLP